jgi:DNA sulfur modification protein DndE
MFTQIKTSKANREIVAQLTRKLSLGKENIIARMAFTYSLSKDRKLDLTQIQDFGGKEYSKDVLFGEYFDIYLGLLCTHYGLYKTDKDIPKYVKMHIDDGLELLNNQIQNNFSLDGFEFITNLIVKYK